MTSDELISSLEDEVVRLGLEPTTFDVARRWPATVEAAASGDGWALRYVRKFYGLPQYPFPEAL